MIENRREETMTQAKDILQAMKRESGSFSKQAIAHRLIIARSILQLSQAEFARRCGVSPSAYRRYESAKTIPGFNNLSAICKTFDMSVEWLLCGAADEFTLCAPDRPLRTA